MVDHLIEITWIIMYLGGSSSDTLLQGVAAIGLLGWDGVFGWGGGGEFLVLVGGVGGVGFLGGFGVGGYFLLGWNTASAGLVARTITDQHNIRKKEKRHAYETREKKSYRDAQHHNRKRKRRPIAGKTYQQKRTEKKGQQWKTGKDRRRGVHPRRVTFDVPGREFASTKKR